MTFTTRADRFNDRVIQYHAYSSRSSSAEIYGTVVSLAKEDDARQKAGGRDLLYWRVENSSIRVYSTLERVSRLRLRGGVRFSRRNN